MKQSSCQLAKANAKSNGKRQAQKINVSSRPQYIKSLSKLWNHGSNVRGFLMECMKNAFSNDPRLKGIAGYVEDNFEGRWAVHEAVDREAAFTVISHSLFARFTSRQKDQFSAKALAAMRFEFGGHEIKKSK